MWTVQGEFLTLLIPVRSRLDSLDITSMSRFSLCVHSHNLPTLNAIEPVRSLSIIGLLSQSLPKHSVVQLRITQLCPQVYNAASYQQHGVLFCKCATLDDTSVYH